MFGGSIPGFIPDARNPDEVVHGGLFQFDCTTQIWTRLRADSEAGPDCVKLRSRIGHSMLYNERERTLCVLSIPPPLLCIPHRKLPPRNLGDGPGPWKHRDVNANIENVFLMACRYFFAGQRKDEKSYLSDFYKYIVDTKELVEISRDCSKQGGPLPGYRELSGAVRRATQRLCCQLEWAAGAYLRPSASSCPTSHPLCTHTIGSPSGPRLTASARNSTLSRDCFRNEYRAK